MKICINGIGNIGTTLALILNDYKSYLGIESVICYKNLFRPWQMVDLDFLKAKGIKVISSDAQSLETVLNNVDFVFDTTSNGMGLKNKVQYQKHSNLMGAIAQGSEKNFGIPFMSGIDQDISSSKFTQIVSCNTHGAASLLQLVTGNRLEKLESADFVVVRRSEDLGNHERLVTANVVARHLSPVTGTHHAIDVKDMFNSININCNITSSDITTPSQLMHGTRFNIQLKDKFDPETLHSKIKKNPFIATTQKFDSNQIFELGRRYGKYGRIFNHIILVKNNLLITENSIKGWAFVPQEGNTIISTIDAFTRMVKLQNRAEAITKIKSDLLQDLW